VHLTINDPDLLAELSRYGDDSAQQHITLVALRLGLQALRHARGEVDALALQQTAERVLEEIDGRVTHHLSQHSAVLLKQFSLDQPDSALSKLVQTHDGFYAQLTKQSGEHYTNIVARLEAMTIRRQAQRQSTQGGKTFEEGVGAVLSELTSAAGDSCDVVGDVAGCVSACKVGDFVIRLGSDCLAAGERIVVEAKRDGSYGRERALSECKVARENRDAQIAIFVWDATYGRAKHQPPLARYGSAIIVLWDEHDPATDIYAQAAYWLARSLVAPQPQDSRVLKTQQRLVDASFDQILGLSSMLDRMKKAGEDVVKKGQEVASTALTVQSLLQAQVENLRELTVVRGAVTTEGEALIVRSILSERLAQD